MASIPKGMTWLAILLLLSQWASISCVEEEALLLDDKDFCTVPGAADVSGCDWIVEQLEDQNPELTYDFFCSQEEDCDSDFIEGEVVDWFSSGCNGPKIVNKLCGCCVFIPDVAPGPPTNLATSEVTETSATITWTDGAEGRPTETYTVRCFEEEPEDCRSMDFVAEVTDIPRGDEEATVPGLMANTEYVCFVIATNTVEPQGVCSDPLQVLIFTGVCSFTDPAIEYRQTFEEDAAGWMPLGDQEIVQSSDFSPQFRGLPGVGLAVYPDGSLTTTGPFTRFGADSPGFPVDLLGDADNGFVTQIAIYLDASESAPFTNDMRFDWSVALITDSEDFIQDFVFNAGWYNDATGPGAGEARFVVSASNNAGRPDSNPKNPGRDPIAILQSGWYVFQHFFYKEEDEVFGELSIYTEDCLERVGVWTLGPARIVGTGNILLPGELGFVTYGWFVQNELPSELLVLADQLLVFP